MFCHTDIQASYNTTNKFFHPTNAMLNIINYPPFEDSKDVTKYNKCIEIQISYKIRPHRSAYMEPDALLGNQTLSTPTFASQHHVTPVETLLHLILSFPFQLAPYTLWISWLSCPACLAFCIRVTSSILYSVPRDVSVISRSLISKSSSWQRTQHAEQHRHKDQRQLMRPHTPTATITRPVHHQVSSQLGLRECTVATNGCS